jgi:hypothetical protein
MTAVAPAQHEWTLHFFASVIPLSATKDFGKVETCLYVSCGSATAWLYDCVGGSAGVRKVNPFHLVDTLEHGCVTALDLRP